MGENAATTRWEIIPYSGIGPLRFGMTRSCARTLLGDDFSEFYKGLRSETTTDAYDKLGVHLYYDLQGKLEFIEVFSPCVPCFRGVELLNPDARVVLDKLRAMGFTSRYDDQGHFFDDFGFAPFETNDELKAVSVYRRGYYD